MCYLCALTGGLCPHGPAHSLVRHCVGGRPAWRPRILETCAGHMRVYIQAASPWPGLVGLIKIKIIPGAPRSLGPVHAKPNTVGKSPRAPPGGVLGLGFAI